MLAPLPLDLLPIIIPTMLMSYIVFGIVGFGTALVAAPLLAQVMPVSDIVPLLAMLDCTALLFNGIRLGKKIDKKELFRLIPLMILGSAAGIYLLLVIPQRPMMIVLGTFVTLYSIYMIFTPPAPRHFPAGWVIPFGAIGGVFSAMFGAGGFVYAIYLGHRLEDKDALRGTLSALLACANFTRFVFFAIAGVYSDGRLPLIGLCILPVMVIGVYLGHHFTKNLARDQFIRVFSAILAVAGVSLVARALFHS